MICQLLNWFTFQTRLLLYTAVIKSIMWYFRFIFNIKSFLLCPCLWPFHVRATVLMYTGSCVYHHGEILLVWAHRPTSSEMQMSLLWRHNGCDGVSNHQPHDCLLSWLFGRRSKKTSKLRVTGLCAGNSPVTGEFPTQMASNAENVSIDDIIMVSRHGYGLSWLLMSKNQQLLMLSDSLVSISPFIATKRFYPFTN